nr:MAG TPA: hypothetical protein [Caudoviricetes sp.]
MKMQRQGLRRQTAGALRWLCPENEIIKPRATGGPGETTKRLYQRGCTGAD